MIISRHFVDVDGRRVHYRQAGKGPPVLMVHQSPRSSAEYEALMRDWSAHFTVIAPDTPGFGQSDPLQGEPDIDDFAGAIVAFLDAVGIDTVGAYGFHSGGIILASALKRHPDRFTGLAIGGYAIWTAKEREDFGAFYLPAFQPRAYGEHLVWLWCRILEQSWFFPWYEARDQARLSHPHADPVRVDAVVREMLDSGDAYRAGYGAVLRAPRGLPDAEARVPPVLITAYDGDPLQAHLDRLGPLPNGWKAYPVATPAQHQAESLAWLLEYPAPPIGRLNQADDEGFVTISADGYSGRVHWQGDPSGQTILLHAPGGSIETAANAPLRLDLPGHGLSDDWAGEPTSLDAWAFVVTDAIRAIAAAPIHVVVGEGVSALLALAVAKNLGAERVEAVDAHIPSGELSRTWLEHSFDPAPDRYGSHLTRAWQIARASQVFWPWFAASAENAIPFNDEALSPEHLAILHRSLLRAKAGKALTECLLGADRDQLLAEAPNLGSWQIADWAAKRPDIWKPEQANGSAE